MKIASEPKKRRPNKLEENLLGQIVDGFRPGQNNPGWRERPCPCSGEMDFFNSL